MSSLTEAASDESSHTAMKSIVIMFAMEAEARPLLDSLHLEKVECAVPFAPCHMFKGIYHGTNVSIVTNGKDTANGVDNVGTVPAAMMTTLAISQFKPDLIINAGTAGGFNRAGASIGDAFICTKFCNHDRRIPIPGFDAYGRGDLEAHPFPKLTAAMNLKSGVVTTGNSLDHTEMDDKLMLENGASVKDMEAAAIAWVANLAGVPLLALKVVTDIVDGDRPTQDEFFENLATASKSLQLNVAKLVEFVAGRAMDDL